MNNHLDIKQTELHVCFSKLCKVTGELYEVKVSHEDFEKLTNPNREPIQNILPNHSADERELLLSGYTPAEFNKLFPEI